MKNDETSKLQEMQSQQASNNEGPSVGNGKLLASNLPKDEYQVWATEFTHGQAKQYFLTNKDFMK